MTRMNKMPWVLLLAALAGCHPRDGRSEVKERELMHTGFEELAVWSEDVHPSLTAEKAHSGRYSVRVDAKNEYSATYHAELGKLCNHLPRRFTLSAWVWVPNAKDDALLVISISNPGNPTPVFHETLFLTDEGPFMEWKHISRELNVPANINSSSQLAIYLWKANATGPVYADDIRLTELW